LVRPMDPSTTSTSPMLTSHRTPLKQARHSLPADEQPQYEQANWRIELARNYAEAEAWQALLSAESACAAAVVAESSKCVDGEEPTSVELARMVHNSELFVMRARIAELRFALASNAVRRAEAEAVKQQLTKDIGTEYAVAAADPIPMQLCNELLGLENRLMNDSLFNRRARYVRD